MTAWTLSIRGRVDEPVDASPIDLSRWQSVDADVIRRTTLDVGGRTVALGEMFDVAVDSDADDRLTLCGNLEHFHHLGGRHRSGQLWIDGDVGDHLGGAIGASRVGMKGGRIVVSGSAGHYVGHRMRRGEIWIAGDVGDFAAASMVAGTIVVAGRVGDHPATAMRRGTLIAATFSSLPASRFTDPIEVEFPFAALVQPPDLAELVDFWQSMRARPIHSRRGDLASGGPNQAGRHHRGLGELIALWPSTPDTAYDK